MRERWEWPKPFQEGKVGRARWDSAGKEPEGDLGSVSKVHYRKDVAGVLGSIRHPAIPRRISDQLYKVAMGRDPQIWMRKTCPGCGETKLSPEHKHTRCPKVLEVWRMVLRAWKTHTDEELDNKEEWITSWGIRNIGGTARKGEEAWLDSKETEERWRVLHAATISILDREWSAGWRSKPHIVFGKIRKLIHTLDRVHAPYPCFT